VEGIADPAHVPALAAEDFIAVAANSRSTVHDAR
jgi:hypothetical protein